MSRLISVRAYEGRNLVSWWDDVLRVVPPHRRTFLCRHDQLVRVSLPWTALGTPRPGTDYWQRVVFFFEGEPVPGSAVAHCPSLHHIGQCYACLGPKVWREVPDYFNTRFDASPQSVDYSMRIEGTFPVPVVVEKYSA